jgi:hypothetical protein
MAYVTVDESYPFPVGDLKTDAEGKIYQTTSGLIICPYEDKHPVDDDDD